MFWFLFLLEKLNLAFQKNVEIIKDSPPKLIPVNESFVLVDYQNSVVIKKFSLIDKMELKIRDSNNVLSVRAHASRDGKSPYSNFYNKQILTQGNLLAQMNPCQKYEVVKLYFYGESNSLEYTTYTFDYQPYKVGLQQADDWICAQNRTFVYLSLKESSIYQVRECLVDEIGWINDYGYVENLYEVMK